ncbi:MAG TPA: ABC transporter ATP-binding protein [Spirochaetes bacterium]|nr:ABC transporter ATP-binding protein [Spirochaetota bacterium]
MPLLRFPFQSVSGMPYLQMKGITKLYPENRVLANDSVDLAVEKSEIHAIVGENGAGKTTLMKILYGLEHKDGGEIFLRGRKVAIHNPFDANRLGIGMVHQHFQLIPEFTIAENVVLGIEPRKRGVFLDRVKAVKSVQDVFEEYGFSLDPALKVSQLTVGQMQLVEIIKILYRRADLLILDEPTSVLTEQQIKKLFDTLRNLSGLGKTVVIITHKLGEVKAISGRVTVMRKGRVMVVKETSDVDENELARLMVGKSISFRFSRNPVSRGKVVMELIDICLNEKGRERPLLDRVNLKVHEGEIVGVTGVGGNGLSELEDTVCGLGPVSAGRIFHDGRDVTDFSASSLRKRGLAYVPADRLFRGSSHHSTVQENMIVSTHHDFLKVGVLRQNKIRDFARKLTENFAIDGDPRVSIGTLSGGNIQKVILARELALRSGFIVFSEPTWGLDVASIEFIYKKILEIRKEGVAILLISSNIDEILGLADTLVVMYRGRIVCSFPDKEELSKELIGEYMMGLRDDFKV